MKQPGDQVASRWRSSELHRNPFVALMGAMFEARREATMFFFGVPIISMENTLCVWNIGWNLLMISLRFFFWEWSVPVEFKMEHVTWLQMQLGHLKSGTEDGSITVLSLWIFQPGLMTKAMAMGSKTNKTGTADGSSWVGCNCGLTPWAEWGDMIRWWINTYKYHGWVDIHKSKLFWCKLQGDSMGFDT